MRRPQRHLRGKDFVLEGVPMLRSPVWSDEDDGPRRGRLQRNPQPQPQPLPNFCPPVAFPYAPPVIANYNNRQPFPNQAARGPAFFPPPNVPPPLAGFQSPPRGVPFGRTNPNAAANRAAQPAPRTEGRTAVLEEPSRPSASTGAYDYSYYQVEEEHVSVDARKKYERDESDFGDATFFTGATAKSNARYTFWKAKKNAGEKRESNTNYDETTFYQAHVHNSEEEEEERSQSPTADAGSYTFWKANRQKGAKERRKSSSNYANATFFNPGASTTEEGEKSEMEESVRSALGTSKHKSLPYNYEGSFFKSTTNDDDTSSKRRSGQYSYGGSMYKYDSTTTGQERTSDPYGMFEDYYDAQEDENDEEEALRKNFRRKVTERRMSRLHSDSTDRGYGSLMYPVGSIISLTEERSPNADNSRAATENFKHLAKQKRSSDETNNPYADFMELYTMEKVQFVSETTSEDPGKKNSKKRDDRKEGKTSNKGNNLMGILLNKPKKGESKSSTEKLVLPPAGKSPDMKPKMRNPLIAYESGTGKKM